MNINIQLPSEDWSNIAMNLDILGQKEMLKPDCNEKYMHWLFKMSQEIDNQNNLTNKSITEK